MQDWREVTAEVKRIGKRDLKKDRYLSQKSRENLERHSSKKENESLKHNKSISDIW